MKNNIEELNKTDWEFKDDITNFATHNIHRYSSKYIPQIPELLIKQTTKVKDIVLDPFVGSGTTLLEANRLGRSSIGTDISPIAYLISKVKTTPLNLERLDENIKHFLQDVSPKISYIRANRLNQGDLFEIFLGTLSFDLPKFESADRWYQKNVLAELSIIKDAINDLITDTSIKEFFVCAFSAIVRSVSNASSGYGNLMIDKNKRKIANTFETFENQLFKMRKALIEFNAIFDKNSYVKVFQADATDLYFLKDNQVDAIVTHPPYISAVPYAEYLRLSLEWLEDSFNDLFPKKSFFDLLNYKQLDSKIIGGKRNRKDVVQRFEDSMQIVFDEMYRVLKPKKYCSVVIGNPIVRGELIRCDEMFIKLAKKSNFFTRSVIRRGKYKTTMGKMKEEYILIFQK